LIAVRSWPSFWSKLLRWRNEANYHDASTGTVPNAYGSFQVRGMLLQVQFPQYARARRTGFSGKWPVSRGAGAALKCWSKRAAFIGRGRVRSPIAIGLRSVDLELSLFMKPHPQIIRPASPRDAEWKGRRSRRNRLAGKSVSLPVQAGGNVCGWESGSRHASPQNRLNSGSSRKQARSGSRAAHSRLP